MISDAHSAHEIRDIVVRQLALYPKSGVQDLVKSLYQARFGCGHHVSEPSKSLKRMAEEVSECVTYPEKSSPPLVEYVGGNYARVNLSTAVASGLSLQTLNALFVLSARGPICCADEFMSDLRLLEELISSGEVPLDAAQARSFLNEYRASGCPATHHSREFTEAYAPAYRIILREYCRLLPAFLRIDGLAEEKERVLIAIEGGSASGKTSLAELMSSIYESNVFHMDDFFLQKHQRTPERLSSPGGNVDYERFQSEVLTPLLCGRAFSYRPFDCHTMDFMEPVSVHPKVINIVEGSYSMHPAFKEPYDFSIFLDIEPSVQSSRIIDRNGSTLHKRFIEEWIPMENMYFLKTQARKRCDISLKIMDGADNTYEQK